MSVNSISDAELIRRAISNANLLPKTKRARVKPLWAKVGDRFSLGSTYARQLCQRFGYDPDQDVRL